MHRTESCTFDHLEGTQIDRSAKVVEIVNYRQEQARETSVVRAGVNVLLWTEGQAVMRLGEEKGVSP